MKLEVYNTDHYVSLEDAKNSYAANSIDIDMRSKRELVMVVSAMQRVSYLLAGSYHTMAFVLDGVELTADEILYVEVTDLS